MKTKKTKIVKIPGIEDDKIYSRGKVVGSVPRIFFRVSGNKAVLVSNTHVLEHDAENIANKHLSYTNMKWKAVDFKVGGSRANVQWKFGDPKNELPYRVYLVGKKDTRSKPERQKEAKRAVKPHDWKVVVNRHDTGYYAVLAKVTKDGIEMYRIEYIEEPGSSGITTKGDTIMVWDFDASFADLDNADDWGYAYKNYTKKQWIKLPYIKRALKILNDDPYIFGNFVGTYNDLKSALRYIDMTKFYETLK